MPQPRTLQGKTVKIGDRLKLHGDTNGLTQSVISAVDHDKGLVQFKGETYHWYSIDWYRHLYEDEIEDRRNFGFRD